MREYLKICLYALLIGTLLAGVIRVAVSFRHSGYPLHAQYTENYVDYMDSVIGGVDR